MIYYTPSAVRAGVLRQTPIYLIQCVKPMAEYTRPSMRAPVVRQAPAYFPIFDTTQYNKYPAHAACCQRCGLGSGANTSIYDIACSMNDAIRAVGNAGGSGATDACIVDITCYINDLMHAVGNAGRGAVAHAGICDLVCHMNDQVHTVGGAGRVV